MEDEVKELIQTNILSEPFKNITTEYKNKKGKNIAEIIWDEISKIEIEIAKNNLKIIKERERKRKLLSNIQVGDYLIRKNGKISRVTCLLGDQIQDGGGNGSFYLLSHGGASYSGTLDFPIKKDKIVLTNEKKPAWFWIFSEKILGGNRGIHFQIDIKVWREI